MSLSLASLADTFRPWAEWIVNLAKYADASVRVTSTFRTHAKQQELYKAWRQGRSRYPAARPGNSAHEYGYAVDLVFSNADARDVVRNIWVGAGGNLGNDDEIHFEFSNWRDLVQYGDPGTIDTPTASPTPEVEGGFGTSGTAWDNFANLLVSFVPWVGGIMSIANIASDLASLWGGDQNVALWYISHPAQLERDAAAIAEAIGFRIFNIGQ